MTHEWLVSDCVASGLTRNWNPALRGPLGVLQVVLGDPTPGSPFIASINKRAALRRHRSQYGRHSKGLGSAVQLGRRQLSRSAGRSLSSCWRRNISSLKNERLPQFEDLLGQQ